MGNFESLLKVGPQTYLKQEKSGVEKYFRPVGFLGVSGLQQNEVRVFHFPSIWHLDIKTFASSNHMEAKL